MEPTIRQEQSGLRLSRGCIVVINTVSTLIEQMFGDHCDLCMAFVDFDLFKKRSVVEKIIKLFL